VPGSASKLESSANNLRPGKRSSILTLRRERERFSIDQDRKELPKAVKNRSSQEGRENGRRYRDLHSNGGGLDGKRARQHRQDDPVSSVPETS